MSYKGQRAGARLASMCQGREAGEGSWEGSWSRVGPFRRPEYEALLGHSLAKPQVAESSFASVTPFSSACVLRVLS